MCKKGIKIEEILKLHNKGLSTTEIGRSLNCTQSNVSRRLKKIGETPIEKRGSRNRTNRYLINEKYFDKINTPEKAYILGLLYADGSVVKDGFYIKMKDLDVLLKVKKALKAEQPIKFVEYGEYNAYLFKVCSQKISKSLISHKCFINKTYTLSFPDIDPQLYSHFTRGYFDGDGCLAVYPYKGACRIDFTSASVKLLEDLRIIISSFSISSGGLRKENGKSNAWHLNFTGAQVNTILDWMYKDATIYMNRKHKKYLHYKNVHVKQDELSGKPCEGNQQPSLDSNIFEGSTTNSRVLTSSVEDSNANTSVLPGIKGTTFEIILNRDFSKTGDDIV